MFRRFFVLAALVAVSVLAPTAHAARSYDNCTGFIDSLPASITTQGTWCLRQDLNTAMSSGAAITVSTNNVIIDCNDFKLGGLAAGAASMARGISTPSPRSNTTVHNCSVRGFWYGVVLVGSGHTVEDNRFDGNLYTAVTVMGDGSVVQRNRVRDTGGSQATLGEARGMYLNGSIHAIDNTVSGVAPSSNNGQGVAYGLFVYNNVDGSIRDNRITGLTRVGDGGAYGIYNIDAGLLSITGNHVASYSGSIGIACTNANQRARDNVVMGFANAMVQCRDDGNSL